jgi:hypothetical protein
MIEAALEEARFLLEFLQRFGCLKPRPIDRDCDVRWGLRMKLALDEARDPGEREQGDDERQYLLKLLARDAVLPRKRGRPPTKDRDRWIVRVIERLRVVHGLVPTRNREGGEKPHRQPTACEIVARVLDELGISLTIPSIESVWSNRPTEIDVDCLPTRCPPGETRVRFDVPQLTLWFDSSSPETVRGK